MRLLTLLYGTLLSLLVPAWASAQDAPTAEPPSTASAAEATPAAAPQAATTSPVGEDARLDALVRELDALKLEVQTLKDEKAAADAEALLQEVEQGQVEAEAPDEPVKLYGFLDMALNRTWVNDDSLFSTGNYTNASSFALGNVNLYVDASPHPDWRSLFEVRYTNMPWGNENRVGLDVPGAQQPYERDEGTVIDQGNPAGQTLRLGGILLERAFIQWQRYDAFRLQVGYWLTPFGIWNVDHGQPTLISALLPQFIARRHVIPQQLGVQGFGTLFVGDWKLDYAAYVSNGRTPGQLDLTEGKAWGGRLVARAGRASHVALGSSVYWGRYVDKSRFVTELTPQLVIESRTTIAYDELAIGADASWDVGALRLRVEGMGRRIDYDQGKREIALGLPNEFAVSTWLLGAYALAAYQLPWWGLEPFAYFEIYRHQTVFGDELLMPGGGLNVKFTPAVQLKTQYLHVIATDLSGDRSDQSVIKQNRAGYITSRLVLAF